MHDLEVYTSNWIVDTGNQEYIEYVMSGEQVPTHVSWSFHSGHNDIESASATANDILFENEHVRIRKGEFSSKAT